MRAFVTPRSARCALSAYALSACALSAAPSLAQAQDLALPNPLRRADLSLVTSAEEWRSEQREHILELFQQHVYGRPSVGKPDGMTFDLVETDAQAMSGSATLKRVEISIPNADRTRSVTIRLTLFLPNLASPIAAPTGLQRRARVAARGPARAARAHGATRGVRGQCVERCVG